MAVYSEVFERSRFSTPDRHTCAKGGVKNPLAECHVCRDDAGSFEHAGKTYVNSHPDSRIEVRGQRVYAVSHEGLVIGTRSRSYGDGDFDDLAMVWDPRSQSIDAVFFRTTRGGGTDDNFVTVDLAEEHQPALRAYYVKATVEEIAAAERKAWHEAADEAFRPSKGKTLHVVSGRKIPLNLVGVCVWAGNGRYGRRVGLVTSGTPEPYWTAESNVRVVVTDPDDLPYLEDYSTTPAERLAAAEARVDTRMRHMFAR